MGLAILTPRWMRHILKKDHSVTARFVKFAKNVWGLSEGSDEELAQKGIDALENFFKKAGIPYTLTELNINDENFKKMAEHANQLGRLTKAYVPLTDEDIVSIYKACL